MSRFLGNARHWFGMQRAVAKANGQQAVAGIYAEAQPTLVKLTSNDTRKMIVALGRDGDGPVSLELVVTDPDAFLAEVRECVEWVDYADA